MPRFDIDAQRALICLFGLVGFAAEGIAYYLTGHSLPDIMNGGLITMIVGPVARDTVEKYRERKRHEESKASPSPPPQSSSPPPTEETE